MVYEWMDGFRSSVKAQEAGEIMRRLSEEGRLTAGNLVDEARPVDSPLHRGFEWDDAKAAENYRKAQAVTMIRAVVVRESAVVSGESSEIKVKVFNMAEKDSGYESLDRILLNSYKTVSLMDRAKSEMKSFCDKYSQLAELSSVIAAIDNVLSGAKFGA